MRTLVLAVEVMGTCSVVGVYVVVLVQVKPEVPPVMVAVGKVKASDWAVTCGALAAASSRRKRQGSMLEERRPARDME